MPSRARRYKRRTLNVGHMEDNGLSALKSSPSSHENNSPTPSVSTTSDDGSRDSATISTEIISNTKKKRKNRQKQSVDNDGTKIKCEAITKSGKRCNYFSRHEVILDGGMVKRVCVHHNNKKAFDEKAISKKLASLARRQRKRDAMKQQNDENAKNDDAGTHVDDDENSKNKNVGSSTIASVDNQSPGGNNSNSNNVIDEEPSDGYNYGEISQGNSNNNSRNNSNGNKKGGASNSSSRYNKNILNVKRRKKKYYEATKYACSICGKHGHTRPTCPEIKILLESRELQLKMKHSSKGKRKRNVVGHERDSGNNSDSSSQSLKKKRSGSSDTKNNDNDDDHNNDEYYKNSDSSSGNAPVEKKTINYHIGGKQPRNPNALYGFPVSPDNTTNNAKREKNKSNDSPVKVTSNGNYIVANKDGNDTEEEITHEQDDQDIPQQRESDLEMADDDIESVSINNGSFTAGSMGGGTAAEDEGGDEDEYDTDNFGSPNQRAVHNTRQGHSVATGTEESPNDNDNNTYHFMNKRTFSPSASATNNAQIDYTGRQRQSHHMLPPTENTNRNYPVENGFSMKDFHHQQTIIESLESQLRMSMYTLERKDNEIISLKHELEEKHRQLVYSSMEYERLLNSTQPQAQTFHHPLHRPNDMYSNSRYSGSGMLYGNGAGSSPSISEAVPPNTYGARAQLVNNNSNAHNNGNNHERISVGANPRNYDFHPVHGTNNNNMNINSMARQNFHHRHRDTDGSFYDMPRSNIQHHEHHTNEQEVYQSQPKHLPQQQERNITNGNDIHQQQYHHRREPTKQ
jgi:hypothetical protein